MRSAASEHQTDPASEPGRESEFDRLVVNILRGSSWQWPFDQSEATSREFLDFARRHRLLPLIQHKLRTAGFVDEWPASVRDGLNQAVRSEAAYQMLRNREIERLIQACHDVGIEPIFFKGIALAHTVYPKPQIRPSVDVDLIVRPPELSQVVAILTSLGYAPYAPYRGAMHSNEVVCRRTTGNAKIEFDCHSAINNRPLLARLLSYDELRDRSMTVKNTEFLIPCAAHSLILACLHRVAHHNTEDLLWLSDFAYLAEAMSDAEKSDFCAIAARMRVRRVCAASLCAAAQTLERNDLKQLAACLQSETAGEEPSAIYLRENRHPVGDAMIRWKSLESTSQRAKFAIEMVFPSREFLRWKYGKAGYWFYVRNLWDVLRLISRGLLAKPAKSDTDVPPNRRGPSHS